MNSIVTSRTSGGRRKPFIASISLAVGDDVLDVDRRWNRVERQVVRIDHLDTFSRYEPELSIGGFRDGRIEVGGRNGPERDAVRRAPKFRFDPAGRVGDPRVQLVTRDTHETAGRVHPQRTTVVFDRPVNRVARQTVGSRERADAAILDPAEAAFFGCGPHRAIAIEPETRDMALAEPIRSGVRRADLSVLEVQHAAVLPECQPHSAVVGDDDLGLLLTSERRPGEVLDESSVPKARQDPRCPKARGCPPRRPRWKSTSLLGRPSTATNLSCLEIGESASSCSPRRARRSPGTETASRSSGSPFALRKTVDRPSFHRVTPSLARHPDTAVCGREHGLGGIAGQALLRGDRDDGQLSKTVQSALAGEPDVAFAIFEKTAGDVARKAVGLRKRVRLAILHMDESSLHRFRSRYRHRGPGAACWT